MRNHDVFAILRILCTTQTKQNHKKFTEIAAQYNGIIHPIKWKYVQIETTEKIQLHKNFMFGFFSIIIVNTFIYVSVCWN